MRIGVIADIHGNLVALRDVLAALAPRADGGIACLGDVVDGAGEDEGCVAELRARGIPTVLGRHDERALKSGRAALGAESAAWLASLPPQREFGGLVLVHDNPIARARLTKGMWRRGTYVRHLLAAQVVFEEAELFRSRPDAIVALGHTHLPAVFSPEAEIPLSEGHPAYLRLGKPYLINPGAVGYSSDGRSAHAGVWDAEAREFTVIRVETRTLSQADYRAP